MKCRAVVDVIGPPFCNAVDVVVGESFHTFYMSLKFLLSDDNDKPNG